MNANFLAWVWPLLHIPFWTTLPDSWSAPRISETRNLDNFTELQLSTSATVFVRQGPQQQVAIEATEAELQRLETVVTGGRLSIRYQQASGWKSRWSNLPFLSAVRIYVTMPQPRVLDVSGAGSLIAEEVKTDALTVHLRGSGKLQVSKVAANRVQAHMIGSGELQLLNIHADTLYSVLSGSGSSTLSGQCPELAVSVRGSGRLKAPELAASHCRASVSGSGSCRVRVATSLRAQIRGSGAIFVTGNPEIVDHTSGSGRVHHY